MQKDRASSVLLSFLYNERGSPRGSLPQMIVDRCRLFTEVSVKHYHQEDRAYTYVEAFLKMFYLIFGQAYSRNYLDVDTYM